jgi:hypothetical protein
VEAYPDFSLAVPIFIYYARALVLYGLANHRGVKSLPKYLLRLIWNREMQPMPICDLPASQPDRSSVRHELGSSAIYDARYDSWLISALMVAIVIGLLMWFRHKHWI